MDRDDSILQRLIRWWLLRGGDVAGLEKRSGRLSSLTNAINDKIRRLKTAVRANPDIESFDGRDRLAISVLEDQPPWSDIEPTASHIPGMISNEERQYCEYLGRFFRGVGEAVELGPWLGCSTCHIVAGLAVNPNFVGRKLHVCDNFVWQADWMDNWIDPADRPDHLADFRHLFDRYTAGFAENLVVQKRSIAQTPDNIGVADLTWDGRPVEILYVDCGRTMDVNEAWYHKFLPAMIPDTTMIIMQDWGTHRIVPVKWFNQVKQFIESKGSALQPIHELRQGDAATFIYRGKR